jgi:antitoxin YefM
LPAKGHSPIVIIFEKQNKRMSSITIEKFKKDMDNQFEQVPATGKELIISGHRKKAVTISLKEFNSLKETAYLLSIENNRNRLSKSFAQARKKEFVKADLSDLDEA